MPKQSIEKPETEVVLMGESIKSKGKEEWKTHRMGWRADAGSSIWGVFLITVGIIFFLIIFYGVSPAIWQKFFQFWPLLLILVGVQVILGQNLLSKIIILIFSILFFGFAAISSLKQVDPVIVSGLPKEVLNFINQFEMIKRI